MTDKISDYRNRVENGEPFEMNGRAVQWQKAQNLKAGSRIAVTTIDPTIDTNEVREGGAIFDEIVSIKKVGREHVYDIEVEGTRNFVGNGIVAHNTYVSGNVGIGTTAPAHKIDVVGTAGLSTGTLWTNTSDARIKTNVETISDAMSIVSALNPVQFKYTSEYLAAHPEIQNVEHYGFIAQDFQKVFPNSVSATGPNGLLQINASNVIPYAIKAVQELSGTQTSFSGQLSDFSVQLAGLKSQEASISAQLTKVLDVSEFSSSDISFKKPVSIEGSLVLKSAVVPGGLIPQSGTATAEGSTLNNITRQNPDGTYTSDLTLTGSGGGAVIVANADLKVDSTKELIFAEGETFSATPEGKVSPSASLGYNSTGGYLATKIGGKETARFKSNGDVDINGAFNNNAFDLAESYPTLDSTLEAGDVVALDPNYPYVDSTRRVGPASDPHPTGEDEGPAYNVVKSSTTGDEKIIGIVSTKPGMVLGGGSFRKEVCDEVKGETFNAEARREGLTFNGTVAEALAYADAVKSCRAVKEVPIALAGRVPVKVSAANGDIKAGDFLRASSTSGFAEKATGAGMVIGKSLEDYPKSGKGVDQPNKIMAAVNVSWYDPAARASGGLIPQSGAATAEGSTLEKTLETLTVTGSTSLASLTVAGNVLVGANLNVTDEGLSTVTEALYLQKLAHGAVNLFNGKAVFTSDGSLALKGTLTADKIVANTVSVGKILVATISAEIANEPYGTYETNEASASAAQTPGVGVAPAGQTPGVKRAADPTIGSGKIALGELGVVITNNSVTANSRIFIQATSPTAGQTLVVTQKIASAGFTVEIELPTESDITFDYWIIN